MGKESKDVRKQQIIDAAIAEAEIVGFDKIQRADVAKRASIGDGTVNLHFGTMQKLKRSVMRHAVKSSNLKIIAQGLVAKDAQALKVADDVKERALQTLLGK